jgi:hypothetical protein
MNDMRCYIEIMDQDNQVIEIEEEPSIEINLDFGSPFHYLEYETVNSAVDSHYWLINNYEVWNETIDNFIKISTDDLANITFDAEVIPKAIYNENDFNTCKTSKEMPSIIDELKAIVQRWSMYRCTNKTDLDAQIVEETLTLAAAEIENLIQQYGV